MTPQATDPHQRLLRGAVQHGHLHVEELQGDVQQMAQLILHAVERMSQSFERIGASVAALHEEQQVTAPAAQAHLAEISGAMHSMTTELQFHDLISQIAARSQTRLDGLHALLHELETCAADGRRHHSIHHGLRLARVSHDLARRLRRVVTQRNLETGDIDLF